MGTNTKVHFLSVDKSHTHALPKDTKHLRLDGHARLLLQVAFFLCSQTRRVHFMAFLGPEGH